MPAASEKSESHGMSSNSPFQRGTEQDAELGVPLLEDEHYDATSWPSFPDIWQVESCLDSRSHTLSIFNIFNRS